MINLLSYILSHFIEFVFQGWIILGTIMLLFSILIAMFPKKLPVSKSKVGVMKNSEIVTLETVKKTENTVGFVNGVSNEKLVKEVEDENLPTLKGKNIYFVCIFRYIKHEASEKHYAIIRADPGVDR